jgi:nucleotide-binding universal stress UspA family protein
MDTQALKTVLTHVVAGEFGATRLQAAVALARQLDATLYGLGADMVQPLAVADPTGLTQGDWYAAMRDEAERNLKEAREAFQAATVGLKTEWAAVEAPPADALIRASRAADVILVGGSPQRGADRYHLADPAEVMLLSGRPVLVAPPTPAPFSGRAVVVAWKDTRESRRALADALPFLVRAETVVVTEICATDEKEPAVARTGDVVAGLQRHGVAAHARVVLAAPDRVATELNIAADAIGADLIVAGGYGHSRLGEWVFGGVTRELLTSPARYVLLSH